MAELTVKAELVWTQGLLSSPCLPLSTHFLKQSPFSFTKGKGETVPGSQPVLLLHFPNDMEKQGCLSTPCPNNISTALCFSKSKPSWVRWDLHFQLPPCPHGRIFASENKGRTLGKRRSSLAYRKPEIPLSAEKGRMFLQEPSQVLRRRQSPFVNSFYRVAQNPHYWVLKTQRTQNFFSGLPPGLPPTGPSNNPQTAWIPRYQGFDPMASPLLQK